MDKFNTFKLFIEEHKNKLIALVLIISILTLSTLLFLNIDKKTKTKTESIVFNGLNLEEKKEEDNNSKKYIYVDIKGSVKLPGVYAIEENKRVVDAINIAGGLKEDADTTLLNLSTKLKDQMVIIVYSKNLEKSINNTLSQDSFQEQSKVCNEEIKNDACIVNNDEMIIIPDLLEYNNDISNNNSKININNSSLNDLMTLPKIGKVKAEAIISYREKNGNFKSIDEIKNVKGIGDTLFESIKEYITI